jgi:hypothetical protein
VRRDVRSPPLTKNSGCAGTLHGGDDTESYP